MIKKKLLMKNKILQKDDTCNQTYGCRHSNPELCKYIDLEGKCAFASEDEICKFPPKSWKIFFNEKKGN